MRYLASLLILCCCIPIANTNAQCLAGETEVFIDVTTDAYGYEIYWELLPAPNPCGTGTIFDGGNPAVGCDGGGDQNQFPGGYGDNLTITEGPWCLITGSDYVIEWVDDWGDGGASFDVLIAGFPVHSFLGSGAGNRFTFGVNEADDYDADITDITTPGFTAEAGINPRFNLLNRGTMTINELDVSYSVDGGASIDATLTGLSIAPFTTASLEHPDAWTTAPGSYDLEVTIGDVNGNTDADMSNNSLSKTISVSDPIPNLVDVFVAFGGGNSEVIANSADGLSTPRDLDFHPELSRNELWIINKNSESTGSSTLTIQEAGKAGENKILRTDQNAYHFMSLGTSIAFSDNGNFATSPGVYDANHDGGAPFTGPTLWDSDLDVYAMPSGGNGSHIDMLHESPYGMGVTHEVDNVFWVFDANSNDIVRYDFADDHGPGNDYHGDAIVRRYPEVSVDWISQDMPCHMVLDKETDWLYVVDPSNSRVLRVDITTGVVGGTPSFAQTEALAEYTNVTGVTQEDVVTSGLIEPVGIALIEDRLLVSDFSTGDIVVYDLTESAPFTEKGRINTSAQGIMGITIGPEGNIWYADATGNEVVRLSAIISGIEDNEVVFDIQLLPNPSNGEGVVQLTPFASGDLNIQVYDAVGKLASAKSLQVHAGELTTVPFSMAPGLYSVAVELNGTSTARKWVVAQ